MSISVNRTFSIHLFVYISCFLYLRGIGSGIQLVSEWIIDVSLYSRKSFDGLKLLLKNKKMNKKEMFVFTQEK